MERAIRRGEGGVSCIPNLADSLLKRRFLALPSRVRKGACRVDGAARQPLGACLL